MDYWWKKALLQPLEMWSWIEMNSWKNVDSRHSICEDTTRLPIREKTLKRTWIAYLPRLPTHPTDHTR